MVDNKTNKLAATYLYETGHEHVLQPPPPHNNTKKLMVDNKTNGWRPLVCAKPVTSTFQSPLHHQNKETKDRTETTDCASSESASWC